MARILQYLECPQYLRKSFFPQHKDLEYAGWLVSALLNFTTYCLLLAPVAHCHEAVVHVTLNFWCGTGVGKPV